MRIKIYGESEAEEEKVLILRLEQDGDEVILKAMNEEGEEINDGVLLGIGPDGKVNLWGGISTEVGLQLTKAGFVKVTRT